MNLRQRFLRMQDADLIAYLRGAKSRMNDKNRMVASAAVQSVRMIETELVRRKESDTLESA